MGAIQEIFRQYGPAYLERFGDAVSAEHKKVIEAICQCRTEAYGSVCYECEDCGQPHVVPAACGNRHCPRVASTASPCSGSRASSSANCPGITSCSPSPCPSPCGPFCTTTSAWATGHCSRLLPRPSRSWCVIRASWAVIRPASSACSTPGADNCSTTPTATHVVPGGALSSEDGAWHASSLGFFLPVKALSRIFRAKFRARMHRAGLLAQIPTEVWQQEWNVNCAAVPNAEASIAYLAPYVFKVAISDHRIVKVEDGCVSFSYQKSGSHRRRTLTLDALEFIRRFLTHVLPSGFMKVRYYGLLSPTAKVALAEVKAKVELAHGFTLTAPEVEPPSWPQPVCQVCGGRLRFHQSLRAYPAAAPQPMCVGPPGLTAAATA